jgi:DNA primase
MTDMEDPASRERLFSRLVSYISSLPPLMGNDAREYAATLLGVSPSLLGRGGRDTDTSPARRDFGRKEDPVWQSILKTLLENERLVSEAVDIFSPEMAGSYREAYEAVVRGDTTHPELLAVAVSDDIPVLDEEEFRKTSLVQLESFYMKKLRRVSARRDIPYDKKSYLIRKIKMDILPRLKKGELVPYESDISI